MLAPDQSVISEFFTNFLTSYQSVTLAAISLRNSQFFPLSPQPEWMETLGDNLIMAQKSAADFLISKGPVIVTQVPQYFVSYSNTMEVLAQNIVKTTDQQEAIKQLEWLKNHIEEIPETVKSLFVSLNSFKSNFKPYKDKIDLALKAALADIKTDQTHAQALTDQISELLQEISSETVKANNGMTGVITSGTSLSFALLSWSFAVATTLSPAIPVIGVIVAVGGLTYGAITNAINESHIAQNLEKIKVLSAQLLEDNQAIAVLQTLTPLLQNIEDSLIGINTAMDVSPIWKQESQKVSDLISTLQNYSGNDFRTLPDIVSLPAAVSTWKTLAKWAMNLQKATTGMTDGGEINLDKATTLKVA